MKKSVGLVDVDGHNFPNLPLMKLSAWHKQQGDSVEWYIPVVHGYPAPPLDRVYLSKVFGFTPDYPYYVNANEIVKGGSGYCITQADGGRYTTKRKIQICRMRWSTCIRITGCTGSRIRLTAF